MNNHHLIIEKRHGDFVPIDISLLSGDFYNGNSIQELDSFTSLYEKNELLGLIIKSNIIPEDYLDGHLFVLNEFKYKLPVKYKNMEDFSITEFLYNNLNNKEILNKVYNIYVSNTKEEPSKHVEFNNYIKEQDLKNIVISIKVLPYLKYRNILFYIKDKLENVLYNKCDEYEK